MESDKFTGSNGKPSSETEAHNELIQVRAIMTCPSCEWRKAFRNQFYRRDIELMVVALKVLDWLCCPDCGDLIDLNLEFEI